MRDRLIELIKQKSCRYAPCDGECGECKNSEIFDDSIESIADHLLANGVIVPPCKVGDTVYYLDGAEVVKDKVIGVIYSDDMDYLTKSVRTYDCLLAWENFGKTYFATKELAEKALAERSEE